MNSILIIKTGNTIPPLLVSGSDFEHWIMKATGLPTASFQTAAVFADEPLPELATISGIIITGSAAMVTDQHDWMTRTEAYVRQAVETEVPVLGICFGHQLVAKALGGKVGWHPQGREIGTTAVTLEQAAADDPLMAELPGQFTVQVSHSQSVISLPPGTRVLGKNAFEPHHALRFASKAWGIQFHPEFDEDIMRAYITERAPQIVEEGHDVEGLLAGIAATPKAPKVLQNFARVLSNN